MKLLGTLAEKYFLKEFKADSYKNWMPQTLLKVKAVLLGVILTLLIIEGTSW